MNEFEKRLFKALCKFKENSFDENLLQFFTPSVLGYIFLNRMQGVAYGTLKNNNMLQKVNREIRNCLASAYEQNIEKNISYSKCIIMLSEALSQCNFKYALLKGAYLFSKYPRGYRTSNDVDILVMPKDVTSLGNHLKNAGFKQGYIRNNEFIPATRSEIITSKMMRGETVPYIKEVNLPYIKFFEVDINFSIDYKNSSTEILENILSENDTIKDAGYPISTLTDIDFLLHLCAHLYKEATTFPWIAMGRDMTLYKYCDIYLLLSEIDEKYVQRLFFRAKELKLEKICAYAILETMHLFDIDADYIYYSALEAIKDEPDFCRKVTDPSNKRTLIYQTCSATERFFLESRKLDLEEIK